jgi:hypothetical protein
MAIIKTIKITEDPILIGIQWSHSFAFSTSSQLNPVPVDLVLTPIDLTLYNVKFALQQGSNKVAPTITTYSNGLATARLTAIQTAAMGRGQYQGQLFLENKATLDASFFVYVEVDVIGVIP